MKKKIFKDMQKETKFYDDLDYIDYLKDLKQVNLDDSRIIPTNKSISLRLPIKLIEQLKLKANSMDIPYQSLIKFYIKEGIEDLRKNNK